MSKNIRAHILIHAPQEGLGYIEKWIKENNIHSTETCFWKKDHQLPKQDDFDLLIILGGPMNVSDEHEHSWLLQEKNFILQSIKNKKYVFGICLGAQLIAEISGAKVFRNQQKEIGWFPIKMTPAAKKSLLDFFPEEFITFHWHGQAFEIPSGSTNLATSTATENQAFQIDDHVVALQFHPEMTKDLLLGIKDEELKPAEFVQSAQEIKTNLQYTEKNHLLLKKLLDNMYENWRRKQISHVL